MADLTIVYRPLAELIRYARNARTHSEEQVAQIAASIREFGWTNPVLIDGQDGIIAGHGRVLAARKLGIDPVPCIELAGLSEAQRRAYLLADNKLALNAGWDEALLRVELADLRDMAFDLSLIGFSGIELETALGEPLDDPDWDGMPEFKHRDLTSAFRIIVHFANATDRDAFAKLVGQTITEKTRAIWYPKATIGRYADKQYTAATSPDGP